MTQAGNIDVHPSNAEALRAWDGDDGRYWAGNEQAYDDALARYDPQFFESAAIERGDYVLDVGCGNGQTTREAALRAAPATAVGVDLSSQMIERARRRAAEHGLTNTRFVQADAAVYPFQPWTFDVAISRTGTMFFGDPVGAFANIARAVRPGGRFTQLVWQSADRNPWIGEFLAALAAGREVSPPPPPGAPGPFSLSDPARVRAILSDSGFIGAACDPVEKPMYFGPDAERAFRFVVGQGFAQGLLRDVDDAARARALDALRATLAAHETPAGVLYPSATWIVSARRA